MSDSPGSPLPAQDPDEFQWMLDQVAHPFPPRRVLEVGVHQGGGCRAYARAFRPDLLVAVNWADEWKGALPDVPHFRYLHGRRSQDPDLQAEVRAISPQYDFIYIDAGHEEVEVRADFQFALSLQPAIVGFHDICACPGVARVWKEARQNRASDYRAITTGTGLLFLRK